MRHFISALCVLLLAACGNSKPPKATAAIPSAPVVGKISAPDLGPVPKVGPDVAELREQVNDLASKAARSDVLASNLSLQAKAALIAADTAYAKGIAAGSAEAARFKEDAMSLQQSAERNAQYAAELFGQVQVLNTKAGNAEAKVATLETWANALKFTNEAIAGELNETRQVVGQLQAQATSLMQEKSDAVAAAKNWQNIASRWRKATIFLSVVVLGAAAIFLVKILR